MIMESLQFMHHNVYYFIDKKEKCINFRLITKTINDEKLLNYF